MEENNYKLLLEKIEGKTFEEVKDIVKQDVVVKSKLNYIEQYVEVQDLIDRLEVYDSYDDITGYLLFRNEIIFHSVLINFTNLDVLPEDSGTNKHNIYLEMALKEYVEVNNYYNIVKDALKRRDVMLIQELNRTFSNLPNAEEIENIKDNLSHIFDNTSDDRLQQINKILEFNDPAMKVIKDTITSISPKEIEVEKNGNGNSN